MTERGISFHGWRGFGSDEQPDLYRWRRRFGFVTLTVCRVCVLAAYQDMKAARDRLALEVAHLRATMRQAIEKFEEREGR